MMDVSVHVGRRRVEGNWDLCVSVRVAGKLARVEGRDP